MNKYVRTYKYVSYNVGGILREIIIFRSNMGGVVTSVFRTYGEIFTSKRPTA